MGRSIRELTLQKLKSGERVSAHQLSQELSVSRQYIHRVLGELLKNGDIVKFGSSPHVTYQIQRGSSLEKRGTVIWFTGASGAGKSTLARRCAQKLKADGVLCRTLDIEDIDKHINSDLSDSPKDHSEAVRRTAEIARILANTGITVCVASPAHYAADRNRARKCIGRHSFVEVYLDCPPEVSRGRSEHSEASQPYEQPHQPDITLRTQESTDSCLHQLMEALQTSVTT